MLVQTKFAPPRRDIDALWRDALVEEVVCSARTLAIINAPAGYGKTTLLAQCHERWRQEGVLVAWYSVDENRYEGGTFFACIMAALYHAGVPLPYSREAIQAGLPGLVVEAAAQATLLALESSEEPVRLIIDDYHRIASPEIDDFLAYLLKHFPAHAALVLTTRGVLDLPVASLRIHGGLLEIDQHKLRFSYHEVDRFFAELGDTDLTELIERTEGWPAVLQLLKLWLSTGPSKTPIANLTSRSTELADYLSEQVFSGLTPALQRFLLRTSVASRICAPLANALTGDCDGSEMLERLRRLNLFILPLDEQQVWFRYHPLLSEFLADVARRRNENAEELHRAAATWFAEAGLVPEALQHAAKLPEDTAALDLTELAGGWRLALSGGLAILRQFARLEVRDPVRHPRVLLGQCYLAAQEGRLTVARSKLDSLLRDLPPETLMAAETPLIFEILCNDITLRIYEDQEIPAAHIGMLEAGLEWRTTDPALRALLHHTLGMCAYHCGDDANARAFGEEARRRALATDLPLIEVYSYDCLGIAQMAAGQRREAEVSFRRALERAVRHFGEASSQVATASALLGNCLYVAGDLSAATSLLEPSISVIEAAEGWHDVYVAAYSARAWLAARSGDVAGAEHFIQRGIALAMQRGLRRLDYHLKLVRIRILMFDGQLEWASQSLSTLGLPTEPWSGRDSGLLGDYMLAAASLEVACSHSADKYQRSVTQLADERALPTLQVQALLLSAATLARDGRLKEAAFTFRRVLEMTELEGFTELVWQFGGLLTQLLAVCSNLLHLFEPQQRQLLSALSLSINAQPRMAARPSTAGDIAITPREIDVVRALSEGQSSKEIARTLGVAESTVKTHRINIYRKLMVATRSQAISKARSSGLI